MNTFSNIIKKSFLESFQNGDITTERILITLAVTCVLALYIFLVYYVAAKKTFYSKTFNIALALIAVITASIILAMQSNLVISLGMVGALSIVRFRTAVKDPMDLVFLFWSISIGIICGAGMYLIAVLTSLVLTVGLFALELTPAGRASVLLLINMGDLSKEAQVRQTVQKFTKKMTVKSRNVSRDGVDMIFDIKVREENELLTQLMQIEGVTNVSLMAHDGEVTL